MSSENCAWRSISTLARASAAKYGSLVICQAPRTAAATPSTYVVALFWAAHSISTCHWTELLDLRQIVHRCRLAGHHSYHRTTETSRRKRCTHNRQRVWGCADSEGPRLTGGGFLASVSPLGPSVS